MSEVAANSTQPDDKDVLRAIFKIEAGQRSGTGFLIHDHQHLLTARHVVEGNRQEKIKLHDVNANKAYNASIQKILEGWDVALLRLDEPIEEIQPLTLLPQKLDSRPKFNAYGFPKTFGANWYPGKVTGPSFDGNYNIFFEMDLKDRLDGLSGGPVFLENEYSVIGIIYWHDPKNLQAGKIVPMAGFYSILLLALQNPSEVSSTRSESESWLYVVRSEADRKLELRHSPHTLKQAVLDAMTLLQKDPLVEGSYIPQFDFATDIVADLGTYKEAIKKLCQAKVVIFDITHYEPVTMLLLGIRSVVKRGVTIASFGGNYVIGDAIDIPFDIKELSIISHSAKQHKENKQPAYIICDKVREGLSQLNNLPQYLDVPTFDAVRILPTNHRVPDAVNVLVLCPYSKKYQKINWEYLKYRLELRSLREGGRVFRSLDLMSPRLLSHAIYESIRRVVLCIIDWTEWRPNVFFELGVRLAVTNSSRFTICIIEGRYKYLIQEINQNIEEFKREPAKASNLISKLGHLTSSDIPASEFDLLRDRYMLIASQAELLLKLFDPLEYNSPSPEEDSTSEFSDELFQHDPSKYEIMMNYYGCRDRGEVASSSGDGLAPYFTHEEIQKRIDTNGEPVSTPVYLDLLRMAELFGVDDTEARAAVLYAENKDLMNSVEKGVVQRLLAAWYFIRAEYKDEEIIKDDKLFEAFQNIGLKLHSHIEETRHEQADEIDDILLSLRRQKEALL